MEQQEYSFYLEEKLNVLKKIAQNTEIQGRFVPRREMVGLRRLLRERSVLIEQLITVNNELAKDSHWQQISISQSKTAEIKKLEHMVVDAVGQVLHSTVAEREKIAAELAGTKTGRRLQTQYVRYWGSMVAGRRINEKG